MIKAIIFDLDGTLADTLDDLLVAMNGMLRHFGWPECNMEQLLSYINKGARLFVGQALPAGTFESFDDDIVTQALAVYNKEYAVSYNEKTHAFDGLVDAVKELRRCGYKLGVLSNKQDEFVKPIIARLYPDLFDSVNGHLNYPEKPSPESSWAIAEQFGVLPEECVFVGDSDVDMQTGVNANMYPLGVSWGYRSCDVLRESGAKHIVNTPSELVSFIKSL